jgi:cobalt-zinc-cadmium efflux system outer membrane protein
VYKFLPQARILFYAWLSLSICQASAALAAGNPTSLQNNNPPTLQPAVEPTLRPALPLPTQAQNNGPSTGLPGSSSQPLTSDASKSLSGLVSEQQVLDTTLMQSPRAASARSMLGITQSALVQAKIYPNPALEFDNGYAELSYRVGVAIPVQGPWKMVQRILAAKAQISVAHLQIQQSLWTLRADSRRAYTELVIADEAAAMMRDLANLTAGLADVARKRFNSGDVAKLDMFKADLARAQADIDASQAERRVIQAREQLNIIMGRGEAVELSLPKLSPFQLHAEKSDLLPDLSHPLAPEVDYIADAMKHRLEIRLAEQQIVSAKASKLVAKGNIIPDGQIAFGYDRQLNPPSDIVQRMYLMGSFPIPIFDRQQGEIARLTATVRQLQSDLISQQNLVRGQVALAYRKLLNARENMRRYQGSVLAQSEQVANLGKLSYGLGQTDITSALTAQQSNIQVRNLYLNEVLNYQQAFTDLEQAVGHILQ